MLALPCTLHMLTLSLCLDQVRELDAKRPTAAESSYRDPKGMYSPEDVFWATVSEVRRLTVASSDRKVLHVALDLAGSNMRPGPGDSIGVVPENNPALVQVRGNFYNSWTSGCAEASLHISQAASWNASAHSSSYKARCHRLCRHTQIANDFSVTVSN